jgi:CubicO group peptidase (beta-lactamase class C family)
MKTVARREVLKSAAGFLIAGNLPTMTAAAADKGSLYFPPKKGKWQSISPEKAGWDGEKLKEVLDYAKNKNSSSLVILHKGRILAEGHWAVKPKDNPQLDRYSIRLNGTNSMGHIIEDVASAQKSVASILTGIAQHKGFLKISDPVHKYLGKGWSKAAPEEEAKITIRHLLTMTSGLNDRLEFEAPAGTKWRYNTTAYSQTLKVVSAAAKMEANELTEKWLTGPLAMKDSHWVPRLGARWKAVSANTVGFATTARDLARFGLLVLAGGYWEKRNVIEDKNYLRAALKPSQQLNPSYGYLWWLNGQKFARRGNGKQKKSGSLIPEAPKDMVAAFGALSRKAYVVPSLQMVVSRLGDSPGTLFFDGQLWKLLMESRTAAS